MNRKFGALLFAFSALLILGYASALLGNYSVVVEENGNAAVVLSVEGSGTVDVPLPLDTENYAIDGALYVPSANGVELSIDEGTPATLIYDSALLTSKSAEGWAFELDLGAFDSGSVTLFLPKDTRVASMQPMGSVSDSDDAKIIAYTIMKGTASVGANYSFVSAGGGTEGGESGKEGRSADGALIMGAAIAIVVVLVVAVIVFIYLSSKKKV
ncbi:MAG: hypothetical protein V1676_04360 [Candidatus Diapherotrites archaeon]